VHWIGKWQVSRIAAVASIALLTLLTACTSEGNATPKRKIPKSFYFIGDVRLSGADNVRGNLATCAGAGNFVDVQMGALVIIADEHGTPIAFGKVWLTSGTNTFQGVLDECTFQFRAVNVPSTPNYYVIVGRQPAKLIRRTKIIRTNGRFAFDANPPNVPPPIFGR
jgi:hypothetical protein